MKLLHLDSSILGDLSVSRILSKTIVNQYVEQDPTTELIYRDLTKTPVGHLTGAHLAIAQGESSSDVDLLADVKEGRKILEEFLAADILVIGAPMYNFSLPTQLKAWIDRICVAGTTFRYTDQGAEGLAGDKKVIVAISRGGFYSDDSPWSDFEHQESYLRIVLKFVGITDVTFIRAEGLSKGPESREQGLNTALNEIKTRVA